MRPLRSCGWVALLVAVALLGSAGCKDDKNEKDGTVSPKGDGTNADAKSDLDVIVVYQSDPEASTKKNDIFVMNIDSTGQTRLTSEAADDTLPTFSPDGARIAFTSDRDGNPEIYTMSREGKDVQRLTDSAKIDEAPAYSPDGQKIVFASNRDAGIDPLARSLYILDVATKQVTGLPRDAVPGTYDHDPVYSQGGKIAFASDRGGLKAVQIIDIFIVDPGTSQVTNLTKTDVKSIGTKNQWPAFSPDGQKIAYVSNKDAGGGEIYVMNASDGSGQTRLTTDGIEKAEPFFTQNNKIIFSKKVGDKFQLFIMDADGKNQTQLTNSNASSRRPRTAYAKRISVD